jgi:hypothetical protein
MLKISNFKSLNNFFYIYKINIYHDLDFKYSLVQFKTFIYINNQ